MFLYTWPIPGHTTWEDISPLLVLDEFAQESWAKRMAKRELQELQFKRGKYWKPQNQSKTHSSVEGVFAFVALALLDCEPFDAFEALPAVPTVAAANELYAGVLVGKGGNFLRCELMLLLPSM